MAPSLRTVPIVQAEIAKKWKEELDNRKPEPWPTELDTYRQLRQVALMLDGRGHDSADTYAQNAWEELEERLDEFTDLESFIGRPNFDEPADVWNLPGRLPYPQSSYEDIVAEVLDQFENDPVANEQLVAMHKQFIKDETLAAGGSDDQPFDPKDLGTAYWNRPRR